MRLTKRERLERLIETTLAQMGHPLEQCTLYPAKGHWRTSKMADVYRFEGTGVIGGVRQSIVSWFTMTECLQEGIVIQRDHGDWRVSARGTRS